MPSPENAALRPGATFPVDRLVRRLSTRYLLVLVAVAALVGLDQLLVQPQLQRLGQFAPVINVAGRQRMLSQKLTKAALAYQVALDDRSRHERREELRSTLEQWTTAHRALREGSDALGVARIDTPAIAAQWDVVEPHRRAMGEAVTALLNSQDYSASEDTRLVNVVLKHEAEYLPAMDRSVKLFEQESDRAIAWLRACALTIGSGIILLLLGIGSFVVRPAARAIRSQVEELETRVELRTRELDTANQSLRREIVERERAEANQQRLAAQLAHASRLSTMGHLTAGLAHELNQPLAAIANFAEASDVILSGDGTTQPRLRQYAQQIQQAALRAGQIIRRMRNFAQPQPGARETIDLNALVHEVADFCRPEMLANDVMCRIQLAPVALLVRADAIQLQQVLVNLLQNAIDALKGISGMSRCIDLGTTEVDGLALVEVRDNGPGIPDNVRDALFQPFKSTKPNGLGIGLSISRSMIEQHQGRLWVDAPHGRGVTFSFALPLHHAHVTSRVELADGLCR